MRAKFHFSNYNGGFISYDYQYRLASVIYRKLEERSPELAEREHSRFGSKMYTFSGIKSENRELLKNGIVFHDGYIIISSPDSELITNATESFLDDPAFEIVGDGNSGQFRMERAEILKDPDIKSNCTFRTLSPVYVKTIRGEGNYRKEVDLYPNEPKFYEILHMNLLRKFELFYGHKPIDHFDFLGIHSTKTKRVKIDKDYRRCSLLSITVEGSPELLKFAYDAGLGQKTAMGFGCLDIT